MKLAEGENVEGWGRGRRACQGGQHGQGSAGGRSPVLMGGCEPTPWATSGFPSEPHLPRSPHSPSFHPPSCPICQASSLFPLSQAILSLPSLPNTSSPGC